MKVESDENLHTLPLLPIEIINAIILYSDVPTACCLARVARSFGLVAERVIWRSLLVYLPENSGNTRDYDRMDRHMHRRQLRPETTEDEIAYEDGYRVSIRENIKKIVMAGNPRRWSTVEEVVIMPRPGGIAGMIQILDMVSENLRVLEIVGTGNDHTPHLRIGDHQTLDVRMIDCGITFPFLTHVKILDQPLRFHGFIPLLCSAAPNLEILYADLRHEMSSDDPMGEALDPPFPPFTKPTRIKVLRLEYETSLNHDPDEECFAPLLDILEHCPLIEELGINWEGTEDERRRLGEKLGVMGNLKHLIWDCLREACLVALGRDLNGWMGYSSLRTFLVSDDNQTLMTVPELPKLEILIRLSFEAPLSVGTPIGERLETQSLIPSFAQSLRRAPRLRHIRFLEYKDVGADPCELADMDELVRTAKPSSTISSYRHGTQELLHVRSLEVTYELSDVPYDPDTINLRRPRHVARTLEYTAADGTARLKTYGWYASKYQKYCLDREMAIWTDFTDLDGLVVPLEVILEMRDIQGASKEQWQGRGIKVGDTAWRVLTEWQARQGA